MEISTPATFCNFTKILLGVILLLATLLAICESQNIEIGSLSKYSSFDEENDEQLLADVVSSIHQWKQEQEMKNILKNSNRQKRDEEVVCYGDLGCFRDEGPFDYLDVLPSSPEEIGTKLFLYTRKNLESPQVLQYNNISSVHDSNFNASCHVKFIIHGFGSSCSKVWPREMRLSFLAVEDCNVICIDWANGAVNPNYVRAASNTRLVGKIIAIFINMINKEILFINHQVHLIGFSLGAHVAGFAGSELKNLSRITGLDPAGPLFEGYDGRVRLDKMDADYVDVIHSNGDSLIIGGLGAWEPIGNVDFYPNGGRAQRGCQNLLIGGLYDFINSYSSTNETYRYLCNHRRAYKLFTNSISPKCKFTAFPCESYEVFETGECFSCNSKLGECGQLGYYSNMAPGRGNLYLLTRDEDPFCANTYKITVHFTSSRIPIQTYGSIQILLADANGINETFTLTQDEDDLLNSSGQIEKLMAVHPAIIPVDAYLLYVAYDGWIYSGRFQWSVDKIILTDSSGNRKSFCKENGQLLPSGLPIKIPLGPHDCLTSLSLINPIIKHTNVPSIGSHHRPPIPSVLNTNKKDEFKIVHSGSIIEEGPGTDATYLSNFNKIGILQSTDLKTDTNQKPIEVFYNSYSSAQPQQYYSEDFIDLSVFSNQTREPVSQLNLETTTKLMEEIGVYSDSKFLEERDPYLYIRSESTFASSGVVTPERLNTGIEIDYAHTRTSGHDYNFEFGASYAKESKHDTHQISYSESQPRLSFQVPPRLNSRNDEIIIENLNHKEYTIPGKRHKLLPQNDNNYLILHKLPNGEALNLENLETYSMDELKELHYNSHSKDLPKHSLNVNEGIDGDITRNMYSTNKTFTIYGPQEKPKVSASTISKLSDLAFVTLTDGSELANEVRNNSFKNRNIPLNVQLLPPRFSDVLSRPIVTNRQNKIASIFQRESREFSQPIHSRNPTYQSQILPETRIYNYIPLKNKDINEFIQLNNASLENNKTKFDLLSNQKLPYSKNTTTTTFIEY